MKVHRAEIEEKQGLYSDFYRAKPRTFGMHPARGSLGIAASPLAAQFMRYSQFAGMATVIVTV